jgi:hypothetical protein
VNFRHREYLNFNNIKLLCVQEVGDIKMGKINCWEFKKCGREPNGSKVADLGICPSSTETILDGIHGGKNSGRACWVVGGTLCEGKIQGTFAKKFNNCLECNFFKKHNSCLLNTRFQPVILSYSG